MQLRDCCWTWAWELGSSLRRWTSSTCGGAQGAHRWETGGCRRSRWRILTWTCWREGRMMHACKIERDLRQSWRRQGRAWPARPTWSPGVWWDHNLESNVLDHTERDKSSLHQTSMATRWTTPPCRSHSGTIWPASPASPPWPCWLSTHCRPTLSRCSLTQTLTRCRLNISQDKTGAPDQSSTNTNI